MIENSLIVAEAYVREHAPDRARRHHRDGDRIGARQADVRQDRDQFRQFLTAQAAIRGLAGDHHARQAISTSSTRPTRQISQNFCKPPPRSRSRRSTTPSRRSRSSWTPTTSPAVDQAARLSTTRIFMSRGCSIRAWWRNCGRRSEGVNRICRARSAPARHPDRLRADVHGDRADRAAVGGLDRAQFRQLSGGADPPADRRRQPGLDRQSATSGCRSGARKATSPSSARPSTR